MNRYFHMDIDIFDKWVNMLLEELYDWRQIGISNEYCNEVSVPKYGLELLNWQDRAFRLVDEKKYMVFLLRYQ